MRHRKRRSKLSMMTAHRNATIRNIVRSLFTYQKIETTCARAKEARRLAEKLLTLAKSDTVANRRRVYAELTDRDLVMKLFRETAPLFASRTSGFTRIIPIGFRRGDGASLVIFELTEKKIIEKLPKKKKEKSKVEASKPETKTAVEHKEEHKSKPTLAEEKRAEKAKSEDKKAADKRGFMKNLRGLFRKRGDF